MFLYLFVLLEHLQCIMKHTHFILLLIVNMIYYDIIYALVTNKSLYMFVASQVLTTKVRVSTVQQLDQNTAL